MNLDNFFKAKHIALIGVSSNPVKVGHVILRNLIDAHFSGTLYIVHPHMHYILNHKCYRSVRDIPSTIDLAVISVPAESILSVVNDCGRKGIKDIVIVTAGFEEIGNYKLKDQLLNLLTKFKIRAIGPNCLGVFDAYTKLDTLFLPRYRLKRPGPGCISFVCQSGAVGSTILDLATKEGYGFAKFISYGNAINTDETDIIGYLGQDKDTKVICLYVEGIKDGRKFLKVAKEVSKKKPIIAVKGGITEAGSKATLSHTGSLAGSAEIYSGIFKQAGIIHVETLEEMFDTARILEKSMKPKGSRVQIITNGGGFGILTADAVEKYGLVMASPGKATINTLKKAFSDIVIVANPMDLVGDATTGRYKAALDACMADDAIDILIVIVLYQTPKIGADIVDVITECSALQKKPIVVISTGGEFTEVLRKSLEQNNVPSYVFPTNAVKAVKQLAAYYKV